jgi:hypothetical protein
MAVVADAEGKQLSEDSTIVREIPNEKTEEIYKDTLPNVKRLNNSTQTGIDTVSTILEQKLQNCNANPDQLKPNEYHEIVKDANKTVPFSHLNMVSLVLLDFGLSLHCPELEFQFEQYLYLHISVYHLFQSYFGVEPYCLEKLN